MSLTQAKCPICKEPATYTSRNTDDDRFYRCPNCGDYDIPGDCARLMEKGIMHPDLHQRMRTRTKGQVPHFKINEYGAIVLNFLPASDANH
ncbi:hypothetical protein FNH36_09590 [Salmonella enterica subsp. diarizonae]|uniref:Uncharacterized protein n=1 Tax=Salmonella newport TaxID=108619 RepID=A0A5Y0S452_SALNE|nr:hypothetical protein [Salmonella enterica]EBS4088787.1 hypothetical protein [Salmonella enterica subsp. enterica serovar Newport]ECJ2420663.1 hypothetical protein [Salmonella enterica subsp. diarizonae]EDU2038372.1 hypothetical protein [Salmonella enterica subsp. enterica serovar Florida]EBS4408957.1 hypothetical protein [Salmonella enterica subsp. enterica serovar Newport]